LKSLLLATVIFIGLLGSRAGHAASQPSANPISFTCPVTGTISVIQTEDGKRHRTEWLGSASDDPDMCLLKPYKNGQPGETIGRIFGRWPAKYTRTTADEAATFRSAMDGFMRHHASMAQFILRGRTGEQTVQIWTLDGEETLKIGDDTVRAVKIHVNYIYSGSTIMYWTNLWFDPEHNLFVKSEGSLERSRSYTWSMVKIQSQGG
jgi:hypothetical protein